MCRYLYAFRLDKQDGEVFFIFPKFPEIITAISEEEYDKMDAPDIIKYAHDAVVTALQTKLITRDEIPEGDDTRTRADGYVNLTVPQAMKLELFKLYLVNNCPSVADFARQIGKKETAARRLFDLRHQSWPSEIEAAFEVFGKSLVHSWNADLSYNVPPPASAIRCEMR